MTQCAKCGIDLIVGTNWRPSVAKAKHKRCSPCISKERKVYYQHNKEHIKKKRMQHYNSNIALGMYQRIKNKSKALGIEFNLEESDIIIPSRCPYLDEPLISGVWSQFNPSLDRIDNSKGYIKGNIRVISRLANTMKSCATKKQLIQFACVIIDEA